MKVCHTNPARTYHGHDDSEVDADDIGIDPPAQRIEGIDKSVALPCLRMLLRIVRDEQHQKFGSVKGPISCPQSS